jgi:hypothetical protein
MYTGPVALLPVRRMRLVLSHAPSCAIEPSELERRGGGAPLLPLGGVGEFLLPPQRCLAPTGQDAELYSFVCVVGV